MIPTNTVYHLRHKSPLGWKAYNFTTAIEANDTALGLGDDVFFCPHLIKHESANRLLNCVTQGTNELSVKDSYVERYRFLIADADPNRPTDTAATDEQRKHAFDVAKRVAAFVREQWGVEPHIWSSGNGYYVLVNVDLPVSQKPLIKSVLEYLNNKFGNEHVKIDQTVSSPGQLIRYPNTMNRKGDDRSLHRMCEILESGSGTVTEEQLRELVPAAPAPTTETERVIRTDAWYQDRTEHFRQLLTDNKVPFTERVKKIDGQDAHVFEISFCPHKNHQTATQGGPHIIVSRARGVFGGCHHDGCSGKKLGKLLEKLDPQYRERLDREYLGNLDKIDNPRRIADAVREQFTLVRVGGVFFEFVDGIYKRLDKTDVDSRIENVARRMFVNYARFLRDHGIDAKTIPVSTKLVNDVRLALAATVKAITGEAPCRVDNGKSLTDRLFFRNGHIAIKDALAGRDRLDAYTAETFITHRLNVDYVADPKQPTLWLQTLDELFPNDRESIRLLQQVFGYCLTQDVSEQKILVMIGQKRAGKGLCCRVLTELVGEHNVASSFLPQLADKWGLDELPGKSLLLVPEARNSEFSKGATADTLKAISGGDPVRINRRYQDTLTTVLPLKIVIASNVMLDFDDISGVIFSRFLVLHFQQSFFGREDKRLFEKLKPELPAIVHWALEGLSDLQRSGFAEPETGKQLRQEMELQSNPGLAFADECLVFDAIGNEPTSKVWSMFVDWCQSRDIVPPSRMQFNQQLKSKGIATGPRTKSRTSHFLGVRLFNSRLHEETAYAE